MQSRHKVNPPHSIARCPGRWYFAGKARGDAQVPPQGRPRVGYRAGLAVADESVHDVDGRHPEYDSVTSLWMDVYPLPFSNSHYRSQHVEHFHGGSDGLFTHQVAAGHPDKSVSRQSFSNII